MIGKLAVAAACLLATGALAAEPPGTMPAREALGYSLGVDLARNLRRQGVEVDIEAVVRGFRDAASGGRLMLNEKDIAKGVSSYQAEVRQKRTYLVGESSSENRRKGEEFLAANRRKEGVVELPGGVQYRVIKAGEGRVPTDGDTVEIRYRGTLLNGAEFEATNPAAKPASYKVRGGGLLPGLAEAVKRMPAGSRWEVVVPPAMAYGERGIPRKVPSNATLLYELELVAVK